ncbi:hypothetical protein Goklo_024139 [Gossypium klotzschianum]|uniref:Uncharacterized protein n=1 Tax=Gossypium klotzschianum TaxID=34286 RepID=A0A7J8W916_9ROSI|nr:hypothetical protein [Gossypium klotzschianum]
MASRNSRGKGQESQKKKGELKDRVIELERSLRQYRNRNSVIELRASLSKIKEMKKRIEELEATMQNCEIRIKSMDHIIEEAVVQIREVTNHIQTLVMQADMLSVKYELKSDRGQELALLLRKIRILSKTN